LTRERGEPHGWGELELATGVRHPHPCGRLLGFAARRLGRRRERTDGDHGDASGFEVFPLMVAWEFTRGAGG